MENGQLIDYFMRAMHVPNRSEYDPSTAMPQIDGEGALPSAFPVTALAAASIGTAAQALADYMESRNGHRPKVRVDARLGSFWFASSLRPQGWSQPDVRDPVTGDYATADGWIRLHANAPHHRAAALSVIRTQAQHEALALAISSWTSAELESAIVAAGGCAATMHTREQWAAHPQGRALADEPLFHTSLHEPGPIQHDSYRPERPLAGIKVLDLTRVLAGPVSTRFLAGYGAQVLRIDPPFWTEPGMVPEVTLGKRCAMLDLRLADDLQQLKRLLAQADVLVHGYRADALERLGLSQAERQRIRPGLVDICLNAYGWTGPWRLRRGFDSLVQMSNGIADAGMTYFKQNKPRPLPVQALDQATGYLMAGAALRGLAIQRQNGQGSSTRFSLARTAQLLTSGNLPEQTGLEPETAADLSPTLEMTEWGPAQRLWPPCSIDAAPMHWDTPACSLRSSPARWP